MGEYRLVKSERVLRKIFGPTRKDVAGDRRKLKREELHNLYSSPNTSIIGTIKSRIMRWAHVAWERRELRIKFQSTILKGRQV
jgi:hypothetical protein